ncbi:hypothetical protein HK102_005535 [Quaeritorhiza haematococci]|nr:hypothetical protein HK102_005535 [Quaeritorhiza haematococci]
MFARSTSRLLQRSAQTLNTTALRPATLSAIRPYSVAGVSPDVWALGALNHVAIVTPDLDKSANFYKDVLRAKISEKVPLPEHGVWTVFVNLGNTKIELLHPYGETSPIQNFLNKNKNGGIHHVCLEVSDIKKAVKDLKSKGVRSLDPEPKIGAHGLPVVFLHPKDCGGILRRTHLNLRLLRSVHHLAAMLADETGKYKRKRKKSDSKSKRIDAVEELESRVRELERKLELKKRIRELEKRLAEQEEDEDPKSSPPTRTDAKALDELQRDEVDNSETVSSEPQDGGRRVRSARLNVKRSAKYDLDTDIFANKDEPSLVRVKSSPQQASTDCPRQFMSTKRTLSGSRSDKASGDSPNHLNRLYDNQHYDEFPEHPKSTQSDFTARMIEKKKRKIGSQIPQTVPASTATDTMSSSERRSLSTEPSKRPRKKAPPAMEPLDPETHEFYSRLRIKDRLIPASTLGHRMEGRRFVPLAEIHKQLEYDDISGDWVTIGVISEKSSPRTSSRGDKYVVFKLTDLKDCQLATFVFRESFERHWKEIVGSIIAILNPKIVMPMESDGDIALDVDHPDKWMKLGTSIDLGFCKGTRKDGQKCTMHLDMRDGDFCPYHVLNGLKRGKIGRQEFASSTAGIILGDPMKAHRENLKSKRKHINGSSDADGRRGTNGTYVFENGLRTTSHGAEIRPATGLAKKTTKQDPAEEAEEKALLDSLMSSHSAGARYLKALHGSPNPSLSDDAKSPNKLGFSTNALRKMGFNPITGEDIILPEERKPGGVMKKEKLGFMNTPPKNTKNRDSGFEGRDGKSASPEMRVKSERVDRKPDQKADQKAMEHVPPISKPSCEEEEIELDLDDLDL